MLLEVKNLSFAYGATQVLSDISFCVDSGEILGVVGGNGAGKSTLIKCITGILRAPESCITRHTSIAAIHQELNLAEDLSVLANFFLGREALTPLGTLSRRKMCERARKQLGRVGLADVDPDAPIASLPIAERQMVEIARALDEDAELLILDEPTALLNPAECKRLFEIMRELRARGVGMIFISHHLDEISELCDRVMVIRDGIVATSRAIGEVTQKEIARCMVGELPPPSNENARRTPGEVVLEMTDSCRGDFSVRRGEIVGVAGLADAGQIELGEILGGFRALPASAALRVNGRSVRFRSPREARDAGIGYLSADRLRCGLWSDCSAEENIAMGAIERFANAGFVRGRKIKENAAEAKVRVQIRGNPLEENVLTFSGGNQQKISLSKVMTARPKILILNEPTQGVDVAAREEIYAVIRNMAASGLTVVMITSDMSELRELSDRVIVMRGGAVVANLGGEEATAERIMLEATGAD